jgi:hypothetical protein
VWQDSLGVESVRVLALERSVPNPPSASPRSIPSQADAPPEVHEKLRTLLQSLALYQEYYYARPSGAYVYAKTVEELRTFDAPAEVKQHSLEPPAGSWYASCPGAGRGGLHSQLTPQAVPSAAPVTALNFRKPGVAIHLRVSNMCVVINMIGLPCRITNC